jgi:hypothetical protein
MAESVMAATEATNAKLDALTEQLAGLASWTKNMDAAVADLASTMTTLKLHAEDAATRLGIIESRPPPTPPAVGATARRPDGHGFDNSARGNIPEVHGPHRLPPKNGTIVAQPYLRGHGEEEYYERPPTHHSRFTPKMDFPRFDGTDPSIWKDNCEVYFEIYGISDLMKVKFAMLNFVGNAALWLKTLQSKQYLIYWEDLYSCRILLWQEQIQFVYASDPQYPSNRQSRELH